MAKQTFWDSDAGNFILTASIITTLLALIGAIVLAVSLPSTICNYKVRMRGLVTVERAIDKGLELRLNGDILKGMELLKIENKGGK